jgi:nitrite reductase/ring-hydroxylating ferredoxin subunit
MRILTIVWGAAAVTESVLGITAAIVLMPEVALVVERALGFGTVAGLLAWTTAFARRRQAAGAALQAQAAAAQTASEPAPMATPAVAATALPRPAPARDAGDEFHQSWYPLALSGEIGPDTLAGQDFLGSRVIIYRDAQGNAVVQSAWCPHLGADLSVGRLVDGNVRCAYHHWSFDGTGRCVHIPAGDKIPPGARIATYPTEEAFGLIWAFNGAAPLFPPPGIPDADEAELLVESARGAIRANEAWVATSNGVDFQHLRTLHGLAAETPPLLEVGPYGLEFRIETPSYLHHGRITGINCFSQHLRVQGIDMFMLFAGCAMARAKTMGYRVIGVQRGPAAAEQLPGGRAMVDRLLAEDAPVLDTIRFRKGALVASDRHLARFLHYVDTFPKAPPPG